MRIVHEVRVEYGTGVGFTAEYPTRRAAHDARAEFLEWATIASARYRRRLRWRRR